jgi:hypothetical protein
VNQDAPFQPSDLADLDVLLDKGWMVAAMEDIHDGLDHPQVIGMRHDVDNSIAPAVQLAEWEAERGYRSTYFILHTAPYWDDKETMKAALEAIAECGHEIGFHINAITAAIATGEDPAEITDEAIEELRGYGYPVRGVVAHGDPACYVHNYVNDELFLESPRPSYGPPNRQVGGIDLHPVSRADFGFDYDPNWLHRGCYLSDSGGHWSQPFDQLDAGFPFEGQLHILQHPDWWNEAFYAEMAA